MGRAPGAGFWDSPCDAASSSARIVCKINVALEVMAVGLQTSMDGLEAEESAANGQGGGGHKHDPNLFHAHSGQAPEQNETRNRIKTTKHSGLLSLLLLPYRKATMVEVLPLWRIWEHSGRHTIVKCKRLFANDWKRLRHCVYRIACVQVKDGECRHKDKDQSISLLQIFVVYVF